MFKFEAFFLTSCLQNMVVRFKSRGHIGFAVIFALILPTSSWLTIAADAQSTFGSVVGTVTDNSGAIIPGTTITLNSVEENTDRVVMSDNSGAFLFSNVKPGHFTVLAVSQGFSATNLKGIEVQARQDLRLLVNLEVASQTTTVEVTAGADQINTESGTISDSEDNIQMTELPLNNRATTTSPLGALSLSPNVQQDS